MNRRRFGFWLSFGLFSLAERSGFASLDRLAAAVIGGPASASDQPQHWTVATNDHWWWYEREQWIEGTWVTTGRTTPLNKQTGELYEKTEGYLDESLVPRSMRVVTRKTDDQIVGEARDADAHGRRDPERRARHGRPPSVWLRSLRADELQIWLRTIDVPEAGVSGMTYFVHLTRDHSFDEKVVEKLDEPEQAKLHAAAHYGY